MIASALLAAAHARGYVFFSELAREFPDTSFKWMKEHAAMFDIPLRYIDKSGQDILGEDSRRGLSHVLIHLHHLAEISPKLTRQYGVEQFGVQDVPPSPDPIMGPAFSPKVEPKGSVPNTGGKIDYEKVLATYITKHPSPTSLAIPKASTAAAEPTKMDKLNQLRRALRTQLVEVGLDLDGWMEQASKRKLMLPTRSSLVRLHANLPVSDTDMRMVEDAMASMKDWRPAPKPVAALPHGNSDDLLVLRRDALGGFQLHDVTGKGVLAVGDFRLMQVCLETGSSVRLSLLEEGGKLSIVLSELRKTPSNHH